MRKRLFLTVFLFFCVSVQALPAFANLEDGDSLFKQLKFSEAASSYESIIKRDPADYEALWRLARCYSKWGLLEEKKSKKKKILRKAVNYAREAIKADGNRFEGHLYLAESLGKLSKLEGPEKRVRFSREIKTEAEKTIELNPAHFKPYMILGIWHRKVKGANWIEREIAKAFFGGLPEASLSEAEKNLKESIRLKSDFPKSHFELALLYKMLKNNELVLEELRKTLDCPALNKNDENIKKKAGLLLKRFK